jgi:hypothetical protein
MPKKRKGNLTYTIKRKHTYVKIELKKNKRSRYAHRVEQEFKIQIIIKGR